jgi:cytochrome P450
VAVDDDTVELDPYAPAFHADPYPVYAHLRDHEPVHHNAALGFYALTRYSDVGPALKDHETWISGKGTVLEMMGFDYQRAMAEQPMILFLDPPYQTRLRRLVSQAFTPKRLRALEPYVERLVERLCDDLAATGGGDLVADFAAPLPMNVIFEMIGVPEPDRAEVRGWIDRMLDRTPEPPHIPQHALEASARNNAYTVDLVERHRREPADDLVGDLLVAQIEDEDGDRRSLTKGEIIGFVGLLAGAGNETITKLLSNTLLLLQRHPDARRRVLADPSVLPNTIEESLRYWAPSQYNGRTAARDVEVHGVTIPAGSKVLLFVGAANRDERRFPDADVFDIDRPDADDHLSFGSGIHFCLGASLARIQARIGLSTFLRRFPDYEIDEDRLERVHSSNVHGLERAPVTV